MKIETLRIQNFKALQNISMEQIPAFCVLVGANGTGKTTLFDVFGFLRDCLSYDVTRALQTRGGFKEVISRGTDEKVIKIEIQFRMEIAGVLRLVTYFIHIGAKQNKGVVLREVLRYKRGSYGSPFHFIDFKQGEGYAINNEEDFQKKDTELTREEQKLDQDNLAIKGLGQFERFKAAKALLELVEKWHVSDFHINLARGSKDIAGYGEHLSTAGDNLQLVAKNIQEYHPDVFDQIIKRMQERVPGIGEITTTATEDGRLLLKFQDGAFTDPFIDKYVSDGTLKMFAYLLLLYAPEKRHLLCVEEPENQLYPKLLHELGEEFELYSRSGGQVFVSSHSPDFLNAVGVNNVYWLHKKNGYTSFSRANKNQQIVDYMEQGDQMGYLWKEGFFEGADPS